MLADPEAFIAEGFAVLRELERVADGGVFPLAAQGDGLIED
jgi:hypothetical protein